jgi:hypothetical protein
MKSKVYLVVVAGVILFIMCILFGLTSCCAHDTGEVKKSAPVIEGDSYSLADWKFITANGHRYLYGYRRLAHCGISDDPDNDPGCCPKCSKAIKNMVCSISNNSSN